MTRLCRFALVAVPDASPSFGMADNTMASPGWTGSNGVI